MFRKLASLIFVAFVLTFVALTATASGPTPADLEGGVVCRFDKGDHDEWGYWKPGDTEVGQYIVLGWTWTGEDGSTGYSVTGAEGGQAGPFTLAELQSYLAPYLAQPLPYGCPPSVSSQPLCDVWVAGVEGWAETGDLYEGGPGDCDCAGAGGEWLEDEGLWGCVVGGFPQIPA